MVPGDKTAKSAPRRPTLRQQVTELRAEMAAQHQRIAELEHRVQCYETALDGVDEVVHIVDADQRLWYCNESGRAMLRTLGIDPACEGRRIGELVSQWHPASEAEYDGVLREGQSKTVRDTLQMGQRFVTLEVDKLPAGTPARPAAVTVIREIAAPSQTEAEAARQRVWTEAVLQAIPDMVFWHRGDGTITAFKPGKQSLPLVPPEEFLNRPLGDVLPADVAQPILAAIERALQTGQEQRLEYQLCRHGQNLDYEARACCGGPDEVLLLVRDITDHKQAERAREASENRLQMALEGAALGLWDWDLRNSRRLVCARWAAEMRGEAAPADPHAWVIEDHTVHPDDRARLQRQLQDCCAAGDGGFECEYRLRGASGNWRWVMARGKVVERDAGGRAVRLAGTYVDVTERRRALENVRRSEQRYRQLYDSVPVALYRTTPTGQILEANRAAVDMLRFPSREALLEFNARDLYVDPVQRDRLLRRLHEEGTVSNQVYVMRCYDGSSVWLRGQVRTVTDSCGWTLYYEGTAEDYTERKQEQEHLQLLSTAFEQTDLGIAVGDLNGRVTFVNEAFARIFRYPRATVTGMTYWQFIPPDRAGEGEQTWRTLLEEGSFAGDVTYRRGDGTTFPCLVNARVLAGQDGAPVALLGTYRDITALKEAQELVRKNQMQLSHVSRLSTMGEMATGLAHELNQPLCAISTYANSALRMLRSGRGDAEEVFGVLADVARQADRAGQVVRRIRQFARKREINRGPADLRQAIEDALGLLRQPARDKGIELQLDMDGAVPTVLADQIQIEQVLVNLVLNAIEATEPRADGHGCVRLTVRPVGCDRVEVRVCDQGKGVAAEDLDEVFNAFYTTKAQGLGMGLSISKSIIEYHGGHIWAEANAQGGMTFGFTLPLVELAGTGGEAP